MNRIIAFVICFGFLLVSSFSAAANDQDQSSEGKSKIPNLLGQAFSNSETRDFFVEEFVPPFGHNIFSGAAGFAASEEERKESINPNYRIVPGDELDVKIWGAQNVESSTMVDGQGNIFLPDIGPVPVQGVKQTNLNNVVQRHVNKVFKENVQVYTNLKSALPVSVFVTGAVAYPGRYTGISTDSIIDFLSMAGGIDHERGSYRSIKIMRNNKEVEEFDIYDFLLAGKLPNTQLREGDALLVSERGTAVVAYGDVRNPFRFEFKNNPAAGYELLKYASPNPSATHVTVEGVRNAQPFKAYLSLQQLSTVGLVDGDEIKFQAGTHANTIKVSIKGEHLGHKAMVIAKNAGLKEVLNNIEVDPNVSNVKSIYLQRRSVALKQKESIDKSLRRLQESLLLARSSGVSNVEPVSEGEIQLLESFVQTANAVFPEGRVVVTDENGIKDIPLEDRDQIIIPRITNLVMVSGEVMMPKAIVWEGGDDVIDYIEKSGGFTDRANETKIVVIRQNGATETGFSPDIYPGDEIIVLPEVKVNNLDLAVKVMDIMYKAVLAVAVPLQID